MNERRAKQNKKNKKSDENCSRISSVTDNTTVKMYICAIQKQIIIECNTSNND